MRRLASLLPIVAGLWGAASAFVPVAPPRSVASPPHLAPPHLAPPRLSWRTVLSGVPGYQSWLRKEFGAAFTSRPIAQGPARDGGFDCVHVDVHDVLHGAARQASSEERAVKLLFQRLDSVLRSAPPTAALTLAADGPGPLAKILTQRSRRRKSAGKSASSEKKNKKKAGGGGGATFDTLKLSPGTVFMTRVHDALVSYARRRATDGVVVTVDGPLVPGEGEVRAPPPLLFPLRCRVARRH